MAHWIVDTAGIGSLIVFLAAGPVLIAYFFMTRWIVQAPREHGAEADEAGKVRS